MRVIVFGANGATGQEVVKQCKAAGHEVVAAVRRPETMEGIEGIEVLQINLDSPPSLVRAMQGGHVVISCIGHGGLKASAKYTTLFSASTRAYRDAMRQANVPRIIVLSSGGVVEDPKAPWFYRALIRPYLINTYTDMCRMETLLEETTDLEWTCVRLTYLLKGASKEYLAKDGMIGGGNFKIHYVDAARFIVSEITEKKWVNKHPVLGYP